METRQQLKQRIEELEQENEELVDTLESIQTLVGDAIPNDDDDEPEDD